MLILLVRVLLLTRLSLPRRIHYIAIPLTSGSKPAASSKKGKLMADNVTWPSNSPGLRAPDIYLWKFLNEVYILYTILAYQERPLYLHLNKF
ncbi:unnamed protein product [Acanthoscelides obtectus]|uniref:Secreted protein n=1 Tax=Acanthoscelides obtectus TaxID=200917 RepID=A0A9P0LVE6_ACAOB|nr:unnamed protein product [Acanthoscelides obtectus]CAK1686009.1 hypothetical protein AOBTE_LOCUS35753 [Acanthoscelides obtectus]